MQTVILLIQCVDQPGIVARVSKWVFETGGNILRSDQYSTNSIDNNFFMRLEFTSKDYTSLNFTDIARQISASWELRLSSHKMNMGILVSKYDHCLYDLLYRWYSKELAVEIPFIIGNHPDCEQLAEKFEIPFHYFPVDKNNKAEQEEKVLKICQKSDFVVLARYMQILSEDFLKKYNKDIINIHHSFLPSFIGANPYHQAYKRGVKIIGATSHFVTKDLDEGPIITQMIKHVTHRDNVNKLKHIGKNLEKLALSDAIEKYINHEIIRCGNKTIIFE